MRSFFWIFSHLLIQLLIQYFKKKIEIFLDFFWIFNEIFKIFRN